MKFSFSFWAWNTDFEHRCKNNLFSYTCFQLVDTFVDANMSDTFIFINIILQGIWNYLLNSFYLVVVHIIVYNEVYNKQ